MHNLTTLEAIEFERDIGRPPDPPDDPETMYREPRRCVLSPEELRDILGEYDAGHSTASEPATEPATGDAIDPDHYKVGGIEAIDYMRAKSTPEEFTGYLRLSALKYLSRAGHKGEALEDYRKAQWFINRLVEELEQ